MKPIFLKLGLLLSFIILTSIIITSEAQNNSGYLTINGVVKDKQTKKKLESVSIFVADTKVGTIANMDGGFTIKIKESFQNQILELSCLGYKNVRFPIYGDVQDTTIYLTQSDRILNEIVVEYVNPEELVQKAIDKIKENYSTQENLLTGFYRETIKKRRNYITISEAVIDIYKSPYLFRSSSDNVQIYKGRKLLSQKPSDTIMVKLIGGPNLSTYLDVVKNRDNMLDMEFLSNYKLKMEDPVYIDERAQYVVSFEPQAILPYALFYGKLYIDRQNLSFSRIEFNLSMDDKNKATRAILKKKPFKMRFNPEEVAFLVTYKQIDGVSYLNYIRNTVRFKCDWKRRLFATNYTIISEMVVTDIKENDVSKIPRKNAFNENRSLTDEVQSFLDPGFWEDYNIIEPTESLESAVHKLKK